MKAKCRNGEESVNRENAEVEESDTMEVQVAPVATVPILGRAGGSVCGAFKLGHNMIRRAAHELVDLRFHSSELQLERIYVSSSCHRFIYYIQVQFKCI